MLKKMSPNAVIVGGEGDSLEDLREFGAFRGQPSAPVNSFTADQIVGAELCIYSEGKCLLQKNGQILACSAGLNFRSITLLGNKVMYKASYGLTDDPCNDHLSRRLTLRSKENIVELLPYLNGLPN